MFQGKLRGKNSNNQNHSQNQSKDRRAELQTPQQAVASSSTTLVLDNMMRQLEQTRKQLECKDEQMAQLNVYVS